MDNPSKDDNSSNIFNKSPNDADRNGTNNCYCILRIMKQQMQLLQVQQKALQIKSSFSYNTLRKNLSLLRISDKEKKRKN
jgi:hypothetical protein